MAVRRTKEERRKDRILREHSNDRGGISPYYKQMYDFHHAEKLFSDRKLDKLYSYLMKYYGKLDLYLKYKEAGYEDPAMFKVLFDCRYWINEERRYILDNYWEDIIARAMYRFFRLYIHNYDPSKASFTKFFQESLVNNVRPEFFEYIRKEDKRLKKHHAREFPHEYIGDIPEYEHPIDDSDIQLVKKYQVEFLSIFKKAKSRQL